VPGSNNPEPQTRNLAAVYPTNQCIRPWTHPSTLLLQASPDPATIPLYAIGLQCESATQCTAIGEGGDEVTFDPTTDTANTAGHVSLPGVGYLGSLSCPSVNQCTAVGASQDGAHGAAVDCDHL
jgi:hypothetical protein